MVGNFLLLGRFSGAAGFLFSRGMEPVESLDQNIFQNALVEQTTLRAQTAQLRTLSAFQAQCHGCSLANTVTAHTSALRGSGVGALQGLSAA